MATQSYDYIFARPGDHSLHCCLYSGLLDLCAHASVTGRQPSWGAGLGSLNPSSKTQDEHLVVIVCQEHYH